MIKAWSMIMVRERLERCARRSKPDRWRNVARPQKAQGGNAHDPGSTGDQAADIFSDVLDRRHAYPYKCLD
jgi:hypothetical protein